MFFAGRSAIMRRLSAINRSASVLRWLGREFEVVMAGEVPLGAKCVLCPSTASSSLVAQSAMSLGDSERWSGGTYLVQRNTDDVFFSLCRTSMECSISFTTIAGQTCPELLRQKKADCPTANTRFFLAFTFHTFWSCLRRNSMALSCAKPCSNGLQTVFWCNESSKLF